MASHRTRPMRDALVHPLLARRVRWFWLRRFNVDVRAAAPALVVAPKKRGEKMARRHSGQVRTRRRNLLPLEPRRIRSHAPRLALLHAEEVKALSGRAKSTARIRSHAPRLAPLHAEEVKALCGRARGIAHLIRSGMQWARAIRPLPPGPCKVMGLVPRQSLRNRRLLPSRGSHGPSPRRKQAQTRNCHAEYFRRQRSEDAG